MAGSIALSLTQRYDKNSHEPLDGGFLYFYAAGTTTPQSAYQDISLTIPWPNPIELDSGGNVPQLFFADGYIKFRLANARGVTQIAADFVLVLGPTAGAGAAPSVDATTILATGDVKARYGTGVLTGFVRANGRTIGNLASGATERAAADTVALFSFLYDADTNLAVSGGRGVSAAADYAANKTLTLPDARGRVLAGLDDMGSTAASRYTGATFDAGDAITLGATAHGASIAKTNLPNYGLDLTGASTQVNARQNGISAGPGATTVLDLIQLAGGGGTSGFAFPLQGTIPLGGSGTVLPTFSPSLLITLYMKL